MAFATNAFKHVFGGGGGGGGKSLEPSGVNLSGSGGTGARKPGSTPSRGGGTTSNDNPKETTGTNVPPLGSPKNPNTGVTKPTMNSPRVPTTGGPTSFGKKKEKLKPFTTSARRPISSSAITRSLLGA